MPNNPNWHPQIPNYPMVQEAALKHRITDLEDEELFIGAKLMDALGWTGRTATLDEIVEVVARLRREDTPRRHSHATHAYLDHWNTHAFKLDAENPPLCFECGQFEKSEIHGGPNAR